MTTEYSTDAAIQTNMDNGKIWLEGIATTLHALALVRLGRITLTTWPDWVRWNIPGQA